MKFKRKFLSYKCMLVQIAKDMILSMEFILTVVPYFLKYQVSFSKQFQFTKTSKLFFQSYFDLYFFRILEHSLNPKMRFLTKIKINEDVFSKGMGPNKRDAKIAAS